MLYLSMPVEDLILIASIAVIVAVTAVMIIFIVMRLKKCPADKIMVIFGAGLGKNTDGSAKSFKCIHGGAAFIMPFIQSYAFLSLQPMNGILRIRQALTKNREFFDIECGYSAGISTEPEVMINAAERLLNMPIEEIRLLAESIVKGQVRIAAAAADYEEILYNRDVFLQNIAEGLVAELGKAGLRLINFDLNYVKLETDS